MIKKIIPLVIVIVLSIFTIQPLFQSGFFPMHDDTQVARVFEMGKALKSGMFPVRWVADLGYGFGYPIFNFYAPLAYYVGGFLNIVGFDALLATKIMMVLGIVFAGVTMYLFAKELWGAWGGVVSAVAYMYAPYHAVDIFVRGDVAEFWAYAFIPLAFYGFYKLYTSIQNSSKFKVQNNVLKWVLVGAIGYAGIILSHNLTALMITPFLLGFCAVLIFISKEKLLATYCLLLTAIVALLLSAFYWLPALLEMKYTNVLYQVGGGADFRDHFVCISQLWDSPWGFGGSAKGCIDGMSFRMGKIHLILFLAGTIFFLYGIFYRQKKIFVKEHRTIVIFSLICFAVSAILMLEPSRFLWELFLSMAFIQYPWRFLLISLFMLSLTIGSIGYITNKLIDQLKYKYILCSIISIMIIMIVILNAKLFNPQKILSVDSNYYTSDYAIKWVASRISDEYLPIGFKKPRNYSEVSKEIHQLSIQYGSTPIEQLSNLLSLSGVLVCIIVIIYTRKSSVNL